jgi:DNA-binding NarL/FixJ family response regulator
MRPVRILIADDHEVVRQGVRAVLSAPGWLVCGETITGGGGCQGDQLRPDVVVLDVNMPS